MKGCICLFLSAFIAATSCKGQTFFNAFAIDSSPSVSCSVETMEDSFLVVGYCNDPLTPNGLVSFTAVFDQDGQLASYSLIRIPGYIHFVASRTNSLIKTYNNEFVSTGYAMTDSLKRFITLTVFDSIGHLRFYKLYEPPTSGYKHVTGEKIIQTSNGDYLLTGQVQNPNFAIDVFLMRVDSVGNLKNFVQYPGVPEYYNDPYGIIQVNDTTIVISCTAQSNSTVDYWTSVQNTCFLTVDTSGTLKLLTCTTDNNTRAENAIALADSSGYLSCGSYYYIRSQGSGFLFNEYIAKWDRNFAKVWDLSLGSTSSVNSFTDLVQNSYGEIYLAGQNLENSGPGAGFNATIAKVSAGGAALWQRQYRIPTPYPTDLSRNYINDIDVLSDGSIVGIGYWENYYPANNPFGIIQLGTIFKFDSDGCYNSTNCGLSSIKNVSAENIVRVFPNPVKDNINVECALLIEDYTIYDIYGRELITEAINPNKTVVIPVITLAPQTVILKIKLINGEVAIKHLQIF